MKSTNEIQRQLNDCLELLENVFGSDLLGVYLYGSYLVGGLQKYSDIDLFVVLNRTTTAEEKNELTSHLLQISGIYMKDIKPPIEITVVEKTMVNPWQFPPNFDFQYGEWLRQSFEMGNVEPWQSREMPDLAIIITQILLKSHTLAGENPEQLLAPVPYCDFMKAMLNDLDRLTDELEDDTRNVLLTLARIWSTLVTNKIRPKPDAADWVIERLPSKYQQVMKRAKSICIGNEEEYWDDLNVCVRACSDFMTSRIIERKSSINFNDTSKHISIAL